MGGRRTKKITGEEVKKPKVKAKKVKEVPKKKPTLKKKGIRGKKYLVAKKKIESKKLYPLEEAIKLIKEISYTKFDSSVEVHINLGLESDKVGHQVRALVALPHGQGKERKVLVFAKGKEAEEAKKAGADKIGDEDTIERISKGGKIEFDSVIATPDFMAKLAGIARILGPRGLMPSPKTGTVTDSPAQVVGELKKGRIEMRTEKQPIVHAVVGKSSFSQKQLAENLKAIFEELNRVKPSKVKGEYIRSIYLKTAMSPSVKIDPLSLP